MSVFIIPDWKSPRFGGETRVRKFNLTNYKFWRNLIVSFVILCLIRM